MDREKISVIIPAYNAGEYIYDCIQSIVVQTFTDWKIILVNDGSSDNTLEIVNSFSKEKIIILNQSNRGVSEARNHGFLASQSKYVVFFDSDDMMSPDFLESRVNFLESRPELCYCCCDIFRFSDKPNEIISVQKGCADNLIPEILLYSPEHATVPSNYMFNRQVLVDYKLLFNPLLSSTADKLFLLELNEFSKGEYFPGYPLLYRVRSDSMSNQLTPALISDNEQFYNLLKINKFIPDTLKREAHFYKYSILAFSYIKMKKIKGLRYLVTGLIRYPDYFITKMSSRIIFKLKPNKK